MKAVYCVETDKEYKTIAEAARELGVFASHINAYLQGKTETVKGYHFFVSKCKKIKCWETGVIYEDIASAAKDVGVSARTLEDHMRGKGYSCGGFRWYFEEVDWDNENPKEIRAEIWKRIDEHPTYSVSNAGRIRNDKTNKILKGSFNKEDGYVSVIFYNTKGRHSIHRLIAKTFIPNPDNKLEVNHKNGIKTDNRVDNLEWVTSEENREHAFKVLGYSTQAKPIKCVETGTVYKSIGEAARALGMTPDKFRKAFRKQSTVYDYHFVLINEISPQKENTKNAVMCVESGETYVSIRSAARSIGVDSRELCRCLRQRNATCAGYHWKYAE